MSNSSANCISGIPSQAAFANITACQSAANETFCWPPNGTRICVPGNDIHFYWPPSYYPNNSNVDISFSLAANTFPTMPNDGNRTEAVSEYNYKWQSITIPGQDAHSVDMYMYSRQVASKEVLNYRGPTLVLVKTAEFPSPYNNAGGSTSSDDDDKDPLTGLTTGGMAGIVVAVLVAIVAIIVASCCCGCCACCGVKGYRKRGARPRPVMDAEEQARVIVHGTELMEQRKPRSAPVLATPIANGMVSEGSASRDEIRRVEEDGARDLVDPPPKYTP